MKKVINGALYNTETAQRLGSWDNGCFTSDFNYCYEALYRTKSGKYFLYGEGGPMSKYSRSTGNNSWSGSSHIEPLTLEAAREWAEEHLDGDDYIEIFGEPDEAADDKEALKINIRVGIRAKLERMKSETGKSISAIIEELVENA